jgi:predicted RND superfamily exporter protein
VLGNKLAFTALSLFLILFSATGIGLLRNDTYTLGYFSRTHPVVQDHKAKEAAWGPYMPLELLVQPKSGKALHSVEVMQAAKAFTDSLEKLPGVGKIFGFHSLYCAGLEVQAPGKADALLRSKGALLRTHRQLERDYPRLAG